MKLFLDTPQMISVDPQDETPIKKFVSGVERVIDTGAPQHHQQVMDDLAVQINCDPQDLYFMLSNPVKEEDIVFPDFQQTLIA